MAAQEMICDVKGFEMLTPSVFLLTFRPPTPLLFQPGQFVSCVIPGAGPNGRDLRRAYSIASPPGRPDLQVCIKFVENGPGSNYLGSLRPGQTLKVFAPYGSFTIKTPPEKGSVFIATGTGISPFRSMIFSDVFAATSKPSHLIFGVREDSEILFANEMAGLSKVTWVPCLSRPSSSWSGYRGRVTDYLRSLKDFAWLEYHYYLCGSGGMIEEGKEFLKSLGVPKEQVHQEIYYKTSSEGEQA